ncbi:histone-like nucleoid-structuring protein Lsr2 [Microbacterium hominis]|uniref:Lsr2 family protein n=1 Tax=Microbacterium hominis TaxID=162426 RepID=A0A0B4D723_9MICO|nr:Lsr2 family protein [Microbacterium hominis]KIC59975.1 hypothetical protein RM52_00730 [Microbacterium hominis]
MAQKTITQFFDDLDNSPLDGAATITFALERKTYEIDLSDANKEKLREALAPFIKVARPVGSTSTSTRKASGRDLAAVRAWAAQNGHKVSDRGRVPASVLEAYDAAH